MGCVMDDARSRADILLGNSVMAAGVFELYEEAHTNAIITSVFKAAFDNRVKLAMMAHEETGMGVWQDKVLKNVVGSQLIYEDILNQKTVGIISRDDAKGIVEIAQPLGPILAIIPMTNPTSTVIFKILISLKSRNPIIISPHSRATKCSVETARICYEAALAADAPEHCIQYVDTPSIELTNALMSHHALSLVLATGGPNLVRAAYSSGTPAIGVGPGNVPVYIDASADIDFAVSSIISSKTFDNGTICATEQAIVVEEKIGAQVRKEFERQGCYFLDREAAEKLGAVVVNPDTKLMNPDVVGQSPEVIANLAGITIPPGTKIIMANPEGVGENHPLSREILAPVLAFYEVKDSKEAVKLCIELIYAGGLGHTASIYANDDAAIDMFTRVMNAGRIVINTPSAQGGVGGIYNLLHPSFTLGCGSGGKNITTQNITATDLINIKRVCRRRSNEKWMRFPKELYFDESLHADDLLSRYHRNF